MGCCFVYSNLVSILLAGGHLVEKVDLYADFRRYWLMIYDPLLGYWVKSCSVSRTNFEKLVGDLDLCLLSLSRSDDDKYAVFHYGLRA